MKIIEINKCFDDCPHCTGPDLRDGKTWQYTCQEIPEWIDNEDGIPDWCPLPDAPNKPVAPEQAILHHWNHCGASWSSENDCGNCGQKPPVG